MNLPTYLVLAFLAGVFSVPGWAPFGCWPLVVVGFAGLYWLMMNSRTPLQSGGIGLAFGAGLHAFGQAWILASLHDKTGMPLFPAFLSALFFVAYLALFSAVPCMLWRALFRVSLRHGTLINSSLIGKISAILGFAALLSLGEWARGHLFFNGFTSLSFGYSLIDTWLAGYAPVVGLYGVSAIGFCLSGLLANLVPPFDRRTHAPFLILVGVIALAGLALRQVAWVQASGAPMHYRLIQPNITQSHKFDPAYATRQVEHMVEMIEQEPADLILTPETAFAMRLGELPPETLPRLQKFSAQTGSHVFLGIITISASSDGYNSLVQIAPHQGGMAQYNKRRLMPFGEYSPFGFRWFSNALNIPFKDMHAGAIDQAPFTVGSQRVGTMICHEDGDGQELRHWLPAVSVFLNPSNLAWFEDSLFIAQDLQMARMRALETGRPVLRSTNTGITAHIDHRGNVVRQLTGREEGTLTGMVQAMEKMTPYASWGNWLLLLLSIVCLALAMPARLLKRP